jgi:hypothetical protein
MGAVPKMSGRFNEMGDIDDGTGEGGPDEVPLLHIDAWNQIDTMRRCFSFARAEKDTADVAPADYPLCERDVTPQEDKASVRPAGDLVLPDTCGTAAGGSEPGLVEELVSRIQARLLPRIQQLLEAEIRSWMLDAIRAEVMQTASDMDVQGESSPGRRSAMNSIRKTLSTPPTEL